MLQAPSRLSSRQVDELDEDVPYHGTLRLRTDPDPEDANNTPIVLNSSRLLASSAPAATAAPPAAAETVSDGSPLTSDASALH